MKSLVFALVLLFISASFAQCSQVDSVNPFDLERYQGLWYEIARSPAVTQAFEQNCECVTAEYAIQGPGNVQVLNTCFNTVSQSLFTIEGSAVQEDPENTPASLTVTFPAVPGGPTPQFNYNVVILGEDYDYAIVYSCEQTPFGQAVLQWLLARDPRPDQASIDSILAEAEALTGFPAAQMGQFSQREDCPRRTEDTSCGDIIAPSVVDIIVASPNHTYLEAIVTQLGLAGAMLEDVTIFAPDDDAFRSLFKKLKIPPRMPLKNQVKKAIKKLGEDFLTETILNHIISATTCANVIVGENPTPEDPVELAAPLAGTELFAYLDDGKAFVRTDCVIAEIDTSAIDLSADNGVVHSIKTVMAPGDQDVYCPDGDVEPEMPGACSEMVYGSSAYEVVSSSKRHRILKAVVDALGLSDALKADAEYTLFAPNDWAFWKLFWRLRVPRGSLESKIQWLVENVPGGADTLRTLVLNHVVADVTGCSRIIRDSNEPVILTPLAGTELSVFAGRWRKISVETKCTAALVNSEDLSYRTPEGREGVLHSINNVIFPGDQDIYCPKQE